MGATVHFPPFTRSLAYLFGAVSDNQATGQGGREKGEGEGERREGENRTKARGWLQAWPLLAREDEAEETRAGGRSVPPRISRVRIRPAGLWGVGTCGPGLCSKDIRAAAGFSSGLSLCPVWPVVSPPLPVCPPHPSASSLHIFLQRAISLYLCVLFTATAVARISEESSLFCVCVCLFSPQSKGIFEDFYLQRRENPPE